MGVPGPFAVRQRRRKWLAAGLGDHDTGAIDLGKEDTP
jgi:hypothetical protein